MLKCYIDRTRGGRPDTTHCHPFVCTSPSCVRGRRAAPRPGEASRARIPVPSHEWHCCELASFRTASAHGMRGSRLSTAIYLGLPSFESRTEGPAYSVGSQAYYQTEQPKHQGSSLSPARRLRSNGVTLVVILHQRTNPQIRPPSEAPRKITSPLHLGCQRQGSARRDWGAGSPLTRDGKPPLGPTGSLSNLAGAEPLFAPSFSSTLGVESRILE